METKSNFILKEENSLYYICNSSYEGSPVIETHHRNPFPGLQKNVAELLCVDLNSLPTEHAIFGDYNVSLVYCVLSTFIEAGEEFFSAVDLPFMIQWDRVYRLDPGPPHIQLQHGVIEKIKEFLGKKWVDLQLNYSQSLEEMKEQKVPEVPANITRELQKLLRGFNDTELFSADLLFNLFNRISITSSILWVAGIFDNEDIQLIDLYFYQSKGTNRLTKNEKIHMAGMSERLKFLRKLIELSKKQEIIGTAKAKTKKKKTIKSSVGEFKSVTIGDQIWMAENLSVGTFRNGEKIPQINTERAWKRAMNKKLPGWCYYDFKSTNGDIYGKLYNWYAVNDPRGLAPKGWKIPGDFNCMWLFDNLGGEEEAGKHLKSKELWKNSNANTNSSGFGALPGGMYGTSIFNQIGDACYFWTKDSFMTGDTPNGVYFCLNENDFVVRKGYFQWCFFSVRCIKDTNF